MSSAQVFDLLSPRVRSILGESGITEATPPQVEAIPRILQRENVLLIAPTGSGKTEAALLPILDKLVSEEHREGISVLYITPLRALNRDMLKRVLYWSARLGFSVEIRHGDTPQRERRKQSRKPPDLLITTPETLQAILPGRLMRKHLSHIRWVVIDEVHNLASSRRGIQLSVALERLREVTEQEFQRVGLSATVGNPEEIADFLAGSGRQMRVVQVAPAKETRYLVEHPHPSEEDHVLAQKLFTAPEAAARINRILELVESSGSALIFVNSRINAEMLGSRFNMLEKRVAVHHGSLPKEERERVENDFKEGRLRALVCTSTLELGIDIGSVDLVLQYMSPRQVSNLIQRVGRSGHRLDRVSLGVIVATHTDDILESVAAVQLAKEAQLEPSNIHKGALDVLAHQIVGCVMDAKGETTLQEVMRITRRAYPYADLPHEKFDRVLEFMEKLQYVRRDGDKLGSGRRARQYYFENLSTIPDERRYLVVDVTTHQVVGILGEEFMMLHARVGLNFIVKGRIWRIEKISDDARVYVTPVEDPTAAIPGWDGEMLPVPYELAQRVGLLRKKVSDGLGSDGRSEIIDELSRQWPLERFGVQKVVDEMVEQKAVGAPVPDHTGVVVEAFDQYLIIHSCSGERVNDTLGELVEELLRREGLVRKWWADGYRILVELTVDTAEIDLEELVNKIFKVDDNILIGASNGILHRHFPFGYYMKFIAERFGALKRGRMMNGEELKELALKFRLTPIYDETIREAQLLHVDLPRATEIFRGIRDGQLGLQLYRARDRPSPIAYQILNKYGQVSELVAPETVRADNLERMRIALANEFVDLLCFNCVHTTRQALVKDLSERPACSKCGSALLSVVFWSTDFVVEALRKKKRRQELAHDEEKALVNARRSADLVLSYGKRAIIAQSVYGVGPQTASKILAKMHTDENQFYRDLLDAKLKFITTRQYWNSK